MIFQQCRLIAIAEVFLVLLPMSVLAQPQAPAGDSGGVPAVAPTAASGEAKKVGLMISRKPLTSKDEAKEYATDWLMAAGLSNMRQGRLRVLEGVFIADLMDMDNPKQLVNQLVMRKQDGYTILVYPTGGGRSVAVQRGARALPTETMEPMSGMAGLAGMSGTKGVYGGKAQSHGVSAALSSQGFLINTTQEATTAAKLWLFQNGLHAVKVGAVSDQGGVFIGKILDKQSNEQRNQFIIRRTDGFIAMINPIALPSGKVTSTHGTP